jgi:DNA-binding SARP family transcriptional activator
LIEELWGETPPPTAAKTLQVHVSRLRGTLNGEGRSKDDGGPLETRGHGYVLRVEPRQLDAERFQRLLEEGRRALARGEARPAAEKIDEALGLGAAARSRISPTTSSPKRDRASRSSGLQTPREPST